MIKDDMIQKEYDDFEDLFIEPDEEEFILYDYDLDNLLDEISNIIYLNDEQIKIMCENVKKTPLVDAALEEFVKFFELKGRKNWKDFIIKPEFLRVQFDENFMLALADFLMKQSVFEVRKLPVIMVKEFYFAYYPYALEKSKDRKPEGIDVLFSIFYKNLRIDSIRDKHSNGKLWNEVIKYWVYYNLYKGIFIKNETQTPEKWDVFAKEIYAREYYFKDDIRTEIDDSIYPMLSFLIKEAPDMSSTMYHYIITKFELTDIQHTSRYQSMSCMYAAIEEKVNNIEEFFKR